MDGPHSFIEYKPENNQSKPATKSLITAVDKWNERHSLSTSVEHFNDYLYESIEVSDKDTVDFDTDDTENALPLKVFDGTKRGIIDVSQQSRSYFWLRRIKEIFLKMGTTNEPFVAFDMELARTDMLATCDVYLRHYFSKLKNKV